jgi:hypothetical protein
MKFIKPNLLNMSEFIHQYFKKLYFDYFSTLILMEINSLKCTENYFQYLSYHGFVNKNFSMSCYSK